MHDLDRHHFDALLEPKPFFRTPEICNVVGLSQSTIVQFAEEGRIMSHAFNGGTGRNMTRCFPRCGVVLFLLQTKEYPVEHFLAGVLGLLGKLSAVELRLVRDQLPRLMESAEARHDQLRGIPFRTAPDVEAAPRCHPRGDRAKLAVFKAP